jgi:predicted RNase H-like HicB family nuclease
MSEGRQVSDQGIPVIKESDHYAKIVKWSDEDGCYVGSCDGLFYGGCHGNDQAAVHAELCEIADEWLEILRQDGKPLPPPTAGQGIAERIA